MSLFRDASIQTEIVSRRRSVSTQTYFVNIKEKISRQTQTEFPFELKLGTNITEGRNGAYAMNIHAWKLFATKTKVARLYTWTTK